jgi:hypothetical protein
MTEGKWFGILVDWEGEGYWIAGIAGIARHRAEAETRQLCANLCLIAESYANLG